MAQKKQLELIERVRHGTSEALDAMHKEFQRLDGIEEAARQAHAIFAPLAECGGMTEEEARAMEHLGQALGIEEAPKSARRKRTSTPRFVQKDIRQ